MSVASGEPARFPFRTILHPTDFSPRAEFAFRVAAGLAKDHGARIVLLHVLPPVVIYDEMGPAVVPFAPEDIQALKNKLAAMTVPGCVVDHIVEVGDAGKAILDLAQERKCDLIVIGTHGRTGLGRLLMGSVAEQVLRKAQCPVLTVKTPMPAQAPAEEALKDGEELMCLVK
jgi:nucleotide-binding universal stress UspA family protein